MNIFSRDKKEKGGEDNDAGSDSGSVVLMEGHNFNRNDILICATNGKLYAIHKKDGSRLWRSKYPTGAYGGIVSLFVTDTDKLLAGAQGKTACIDMMTGEALWVNKMPGFGIEEVSILTTPSRFLSPKKHPNDIATAASHHDQDELPPPGYDQEGTQDKAVVIACSRGKVMGIDIDTGDTLWVYKCPGGGFNIPVSIVEPPSLEDDRPHQLVYVGSGKWVYCLKANTGDVVWSAKVSNAHWGYSYMTLATPWSSRLAAEAYSAFSQNPSAQTRDRIRQQENSQ
ncbi:RNAPII degradation factor [Mucor velutinosus]|uniref:RNAPII degradation factor n=1 Tax=Mucor velutinosus TaxID=708070 RepID=A0AAN7DDI4_9FUNG|nr:RNAPII degradation factor [Mucor velutinosus]